MGDAACFVVPAPPTETNASADKAAMPLTTARMRVLLTLPSLKSVV
jgi:hypothetical protein